MEKLRAALAALNALNDRLHDLVDPDATFRSATVAVVVAAGEAVVELNSRVTQLESGGAPQASGGRVECALPEKCVMVIDESHPAAAALARRLAGECKPGAIVLLDGEEFEAMQSAALILALPPIQPQAAADQKSPGTDATIDAAPAAGSSPDGFDCQKPDACTNPACSCPVVEKKADQYGAGAGVVT